MLDTDVKAYIDSKIDDNPAPTVYELQLIFTTDAIPTYEGKLKDRDLLVRNAETVVQAYSYLCRTYGTDTWNFEKTDFWKKVTKYVE